MSAANEHKPEMTFIGFSTLIRPDEGYIRCPEFWEMAGMVSERGEAIHTGRQRHAGGLLRRRYAKPRLRVRYLGAGLQTAVRKAESHGFPWLSAFLAPPARLELTTLRLGGVRSVQVSYGGKRRYCCASRLGRAAVLYSSRNGADKCSFRRGFSPRAPRVR